jgi:hypothetical protein
LIDCIEPERSSRNTSQVRFGFDTSSPFQIARRD